MLARCAVIILMLSCAAGARAERQTGDLPWPMFAGNPARDGNSRVSFPAATLGRLWKSSAPDVVYQYRDGQTGSSASIVSVAGKDMVIAGSYDRSVYAYDAFTGDPIWRFTTGDAVTAAPCFAVIDGEPMLFVASTDRTIYALNPLTGKQRDSKGAQMWTHQVYKWADTVAPAFVGDPMVAEVDGAPVLFVSVWINDKKSKGNVQESAVYAFEPASGRLLWKAAVGSGFATAPAFGQVKDEPAIFVVHAAGAVHAFSARDGKPLWREPFATQYEIRSGVSFAEVDGRRLLFFGSRLFSAVCIDADSAAPVWDCQVGTWVDSTPAVYRKGGRAAVIFGDYHKVLHSVDALTGKRLWSYQADGHFCASPTIIELGGRAAVAMPCLDDHMYIVDAEDGTCLSRAYTGGFLWSHYQRGAAVWSSAAAAKLGGQPILAVTSYDACVYVFGLGGRDANVGAPSNSFVDALGGKLAALIFGAAVAAVLVYNVVRIARKRNAGGGRAV
ncbi:MAG TPA: PQQ-binding-like beta-propeller repeat protein [Planctomycetota bacterium]|nr:PQQ-binding-like beta-propeller repeat protein [Planctomycetota bacterium]